MAIDLAQHGIDTVLLDEDDKASEGSRAICFAKRTLEILDRLGVGQRVRRQGRGLERGQGLLAAIASSTSSTCCPSRATSARPSSTCSSTTWSSSWSSGCCTRAASICAGAAGSSAVAPRADGVAVSVEHARRRLPARMRLPDRGRRLAQPDPHDARTGGEGPGVPRSLPDRRCQDAGAVSDRALVLVRPAVPSQPVGAAAPSGRRRLAHRLPARLGRRSRSRARARAGHPAHPGDAGARAIPSSWNGSASTPSAASAWSGFATGACSSSATPRTRSRRSARAAPTAASRMPTISPGSWRSCSTGVASDAPARQLRCRAHPGGRREHPELHPQHRFHHAQERGQPHVPRRDPAAGRKVSVRTQAGEQRAPVAAAHLPSLAARHARPRQLRGPHDARARPRSMRRCAAQPSRPGCWISSAARSWPCTTWTGSGRRPKTSSKG